MFLFMIYKICHELTVEMKFYQTSLEKCYYVSLWKSLIKFCDNSQQMSDSFYQITESSELNGKIKVQNMLI